METVNLIDVIKKKNIRFGELLYYFCDYFRLEYYVIGGDYNKVELDDITNIIEIDNFARDKGEEYISRKNNFKDIVLDILSFEKEYLNEREFLDENDGLDLGYDCSDLEDDSEITKMELRFNILFLEEILEKKFK